MCFMYAYSRRAVVITVSLNRISGFHIRPRGISGTQSPTVMAQNSMPSWGVITMAWRASK
jgi:hypothetical protein